MNPRFLAYQRAPRAELLEPLSDEELAALIAEGHEAAFEALVTRHRRVLVNHCSQLVGSADAEEAVQEALLRAYLSLSRGHSVQRVSAWLRTIAHNAALNLLRARKARPAVDGQEPSEPATDPFERREHLRLVLEALASLPERQREALVMRELEGRSYAEIETRLRTSNGAVRQLLNRARARLRTRLGTLTGLEPALRWILGNGSAGSGAVRLGALGGGCAVTVKLCATALLPATLGSGAVAAPKAELPAGPRHAHVAPARGVSAALPWAVAAGRLPGGGLRSSPANALMHRGAAFVAYHLDPSGSTVGDGVERTPVGSRPSIRYSDAGAGAERASGGAWNSGSSRGGERRGGWSDGRPQFSGRGGGGGEGSRQGYAASAGGSSGSAGGTSQTAQSSSSSPSYGGTGSSETNGAAASPATSPQWAATSPPGGSATGNSRPGGGALAGSGSPEGLSSTTP